MKSRDLWRNPQTDMKIRLKFFAFRIFKKLAYFRLMLQADLLISWR